MTIRYRYDRDFAALVARRFILRYMRKLLILTAVIVVTGAISFFYEPFNFYGIAAGVLVLAVALSVWRYRRRAVALAERLGPMEISLTIADEGLTVEAPMQKSTGTWNRERVIWTYPDIWILFPYGESSAYSAVPVAAMTDEFQEAFLSLTKAAGGRVRPF
jgi:hypothetical protein